MLPVLGTYRRAATTYLREPRHVIGTAFVFVVPVTLAQAILLHVGLEAGDDAVTIASFTLVSVAASALSALATVFYAGAIDLVVHAETHGEEMPTWRETARRLPLGRLLAASGLWFLVVSVGLLLCVVPGLLAMTVFGLIGPLIVMEDCSAVGAFRRSLELTRPQLARVAVLVTGSLFLESELAGLAAVLPGGPTLAGELIVEALVVGLVASYVSLVEVHTARALRALEAGRAP